MISNTLETKTLANVDQAAEEKASTEAVLVAEGMLRSFTSMEPLPIDCMTFVWNVTLNSYEPRPAAEGVY